MKEQRNLSDTRGNRLGIGIFKLLLRCGGYRPALLLARIVTWFYATFDRTARQSAAEYLKLRFPEDADDPRKLKKHFHRQIYQLAKMLILSWRMGEGNKLPLEEKNADCLPASGGVVVVLAHFGSWQASMELINRKDGPGVCIMARPDHNINMDKFLAVKKKHDFKVISTEGFSGGLIEASAALERGEAVIVMGDRAVDGTACISADYLGGKIELPLSPWMLAARNHVPAIPVFTELKQDPERIEIRYSRPVLFPETDRRVRAEELRPAAEQYAEELEKAALQSPYCVFRFGNEKQSGI